MGVVRVMARGMPIPHEGWKPVLKVTLDGVPRDDIFMQPLLSAKDIYMIHTYCPNGASVTFELGLKKTAWYWHYDSHSHTTIITDDCVVAIQWATRTQIINTKASQQYALFVTQGICNCSIRVCGNQREMGMWKPEDTNKQQTIYMDDISITPIALEGTDTDSVEFKLLKEDSGTLSWEGIPNNNKSISVTHQSDVVVTNTWGSTDVSVTGMRYASLMDRQKSTLPLIRPSRTPATTSSCPHLNASSAASYSAASYSAYDQPDPHNPTEFDVACGDCNRQAASASRDRGYVATTGGTGYSDDIQEYVKPSQPWRAWAQFRRRAGRFFSLFKVCAGRAKSIKQ